MVKRLAVFAMCALVLACDTRTGSSVTAPFAAELGRYVLQTVSGSPMPISLPATVPNATRQLIADTITFTSGGNVREVFYIATTPSGGTAITSSFAMAGKYTITRDSIHTPVDFGYTFGRYAAGTVMLTSQEGFVYLFARK